MARATPLVGHEGPLSAALKIGDLSLVHAGDDAKFILLGSRVVGMVVDSVSDVTHLLPEQIRPAPELGMAVDTRFINGIGTLDGRMLILLDIERMMTSREMALVDQVAG